jgi:hypothetical protein
MTSPSAFKIAGDTADLYAAAFETANGTTQPWIDEDDTYDLNVSPAGPRWALATGPGTGYSDGEARLIDAQTGETILSSEDGLSPGMRCEYDEASVVVCFTTDDRRLGSARAIALDVETAEILWSLPAEAEGRIAPTIRSAWHGLVYGETSNGPIILDARSGADEVLDPGLAPFVLNEYVGVAPGDSATLLVHRATG